MREMKEKERMKVGKSTRIDDEDWNDKCKKRKWIDDDRKKKQRMTARRIKRRG